MEGLLRTKSHKYNVFMCLNYGFQFPGFEKKFGKLGIVLPHPEIPEKKRDYLIRFAMQQYNEQQTYKQQMHQVWH